jgi:hypothetical protein
MLQTIASSTPAAPGGCFRSFSPASAADAPKRTLDTVAGQCHALLEFGFLLMGQRAGDQLSVATRNCPMAASRSLRQTVTYRDGFH